MSFDAFHAANASSQSALPDYDSFLEIFQGISGGYVIELAEMNDGEFYALGIAAHDTADWNIAELSMCEMLARDGDTYIYATRKEAMVALFALINSII